MIDYIVGCLMEAAFLEAHHFTAGHLALVGEGDLGAGCMDLFGYVFFE
jgi:hypothetical protein